MLRLDRFFLTLQLLVQFLDVPEHRGDCHGMYAFERMALAMIQQEELIRP